MKDNEKKVCAGCENISKLARTDSYGILGMIDRMSRDLKILKSKIEDTELRNS